MMRVVMTFWWGLLTLWLLTTDLEAQSPSRNGKASANKNAGGQPFTVTGYGLDVDTAKRDALKEARKELTTYLRARDLSLDYWVPSEAYIQKNLLEGAGEQGPDFQVGENEPAKTWVLTVKTPNMSEAQRLNSIAKQQAEHRMRQSVVLPRLHILAKGLAAIVVLLLALVGYLRLEEKTRGIYTHLLRFGMICLVAGAGAGILFLS